MSAVKAKAPEVNTPEVNTPEINTPEVNTKAPEYKLFKAEKGSVETYVVAVDKPGAIKAAQEKIDLFAIIGCEVTEISEIDGFAIRCDYMLD